MTTTDAVCPGCGQTFAGPRGASAPHQAAKFQTLACKPTKEA